MFGKLINEVQNVSKISEKIVFRMVNTKMNERDLEQRPHRKFLDLSILYFVQLENGRDCFESLVVTNQLAERWGIKENELWDLALKNMPKLFPTYFATLESIRNSKCCGTERQSVETSGLLCLSNTSNFYGASSMLYPGVLENISKSVRNDFYIIPSSVHEILIIPIDDVEKERLNWLIQEVNATAVRSSEVLSNHCYRYDRKKGKIIIP